MYLTISLLFRTSDSDRIFSQGAQKGPEELQGGHTLFILFIINNYYKHKTSCFNKFKSDNISSCIAITVDTV